MSRKEGFSERPAAPNELAKTNPFKPAEAGAEKHWTIDAGGGSDAKENRPANEDAFLFDAVRGLLCVADGVGGSIQGGNAARIVVENLNPGAIKAAIDQRAEEVLSSPADKPLANLSRIDVENAIKDYLFGHIGRKVKQQTPKGDSTVSLGKIWTDENNQKNLTIAQIGDSRIYRLRKGRLERLTRDQSFLEALLDEGLTDENGSPILDDADITATFTLKDAEERAKSSKNFKSLVRFMQDEKLQKATLADIRHIILNGVNQGSPAVVQTFDVEPGDMIVALSDGISDNLKDSEIGSALSRSSDAEQAAKLLRLQASLVSKDRSNPRRKQDDMTAVVMRIG